MSIFTTVTFNSLNAYKLTLIGFPTFQKLVYHSFLIKSENIESIFPCPNDTLHTIIPGPIIIKKIKMPDNFFLFSISFYYIIDTLKLKSTSRKFLKMDIASFSQMPLKF